jgi:phosphohistidine phosphatase
MRVILMRHGVAAAKRPGGKANDAARPLTAAGRKKTREVSRGLLALGFEPSVIVTSPLVRAVQTAEIVRDQCRKKPKWIVTEAMTPDADPRQIWKELRRQPDDAVVLCAGHAPHIDLALAAALMLREPLTEMRKAGVAVLDLAGHGPATLRALFEPAHLRQVRRRS